MILGRLPPKLIYNAVVYHLKFLELDRLAAFATVNGFDELSLQRFMELSEVPGVQNDFMDNPNALSIQPIFALGPEDGLAAA